MKRLSFAMAALVIALTLASCATHPPRLNHADWITLFDGTEATLRKNWFQVGEGNWKISEGALVADQSTRKSPVYTYMVSRESYADFDLRVEFWVSSDANSGIFLRCLNPMVIDDRSCYEANIFDQRSDPRHGTGAITHRAAVYPMPKAGDRWNTYEITLRGNRISVWLNGHLTLDVINKDLPRGGALALQDHQGTVKFRKVQIRPLSRPL